jgi:hypothetical protein
MVSNTASQICTMICINTSTTTGSNKSATEVYAILREPKKCIVSREGISNLSHTQKKTTICTEDKGIAMTLSSQKSIKNWPRVRFKPVRRPVKSANIKSKDWPPSYYWASSVSKQKHMCRNRHMFIKWKLRFSSKAFLLKKQKNMATGRNTYFRVIMTTY